MGTAWADDVRRMEKILDRVQGRVPGLRWARPVAVDDGHLLAWDGGQHGEKRLGELCDWADAEWPP